MSGEKRYAPIVVRHRKGMQFAAEVRSHTVIVDQPLPHGDDVAPMPIEMLGISLGTCVALYVQQFLDARKLPSTDMRVEVDAIVASNPNRIGEFRVRVVLPMGVPAAYAEMLERVARSCPAHHTLTLGAHVDVSLQAVATVA